MKAGEGRDLRNDDSGRITQPEMSLARNKPEDQLFQAFVQASNPCRHEVANSLNF